MTNKSMSVCTALLFAFALPSWAQQRFDSAEAAAQAVIDAAAAHDGARLTAIFGPQAKGLLTSGNPSQDQNEQAEFSKLASDKHQLVTDPRNPGRVILSIGEEDWPFPVPIVRANGKWSFDASETKVEMAARRIGTHELDAIEVCAGFVDAELKYASGAHGKDGVLEYAPHIMSTPGHSDGLYVDGAADPLVPRGFAEAAWDGARKSAKPYHGYFFRILDGQGPNAVGGAHAYTAKNRLLGGFALVAWPAQYGVTGINTFIVNQDGVIFQKDIPPPAGAADGGAPPPITRYDPDPSWRPVD